MIQDFPEREHARVTKQGLVAKMAGTLARLAFGKDSVTERDLLLEGFTQRQIDEHGAAAIEKAHKLGGTSHADRRRA